MKIFILPLKACFATLLLSFISFSANSQTQTWTAAGTYSWTVPAGVTKVKAQVWGAGGGGGGSNSNSNSGGGGGGGAFTLFTFTNLTPGTSYTNKIIVGIGGNGGTGNPLVAGTNGGFSQIDFTSIVTANGGGVGGSGSGAGVGSAGAGATGGTFNGGNGGLGRSGGVGGGGSAGTASNGNNAPGTSTAGATAVTGGGAGGNGATGNAVAGGAPGGGGGGGDRSGGTYGNGGAGAAGKVILEWYPELTIASNVQSPGNVCTGATNIPVHSFSLTGINNGGTITGLSFVTTGTYLATDLVNFKLYYTANSTFSTGTLLATIGSPSAEGPQTFPAFSQAVGNSGGYFWITIDVSGSAGNRTITVNGTSSSNLSTSTSGLTWNGSSSASNQAAIGSSPTANAGNAVTACTNLVPKNITDGASASGYSSIEWTSSGTGSFASANSLTLCTYNPSAADISAGSVTLTLTAYGACTNATSNKTLTIVGPITVSAGSAVTAICQGGTSEALSGSFGGTATSAIWSDGGAGGSFTNNGGATPGTSTYTASIAAPATVTLTLAASGACGTITDSKNISVTPTVGTPVFDLGTSSSRCYGAGTSTYSATASNSTGITYALDATSIAAGNSINPSTGEVTWVAGWTGSSIVTASAAGCNGPVTDIHTITTLPSVSSPAFIDVH